MPYIGYIFSSYLTIYSCLIKCVIVPESFFYYIPACFECMMCLAQSSGNRGPDSLFHRLGISCPVVDYVDFDEFSDICDSFHDSYTRMIVAAVDRRCSGLCGVRGGDTWPYFSQRDLMLVGLAEFDDLKEQGLASVMKITKHRGLRFCLYFNERVVESVTTACRTYVNAICGLRLLHPTIHFNNQNIPIMTGLMVDAMRSTSGQCETYQGLIGFDIFNRNFITWKTEDGNIENNIPRSELHSYLLLVAMVAENMLPCVDAERLIMDKLR